MSITTTHHFPNEVTKRLDRAALVSTTIDGSPLVIAPFHTVQIALTPAAAATLYRLLERTGEGHVDTHIRHLVDGLRGAAIDALERSSGPIDHA